MTNDWYPPQRLPPECGLLLEVLDIHIRDDENAEYEKADEEQKTIDKKEDGVLPFEKPQYISCAEKVAASFTDRQTA
jgi:hypothetical protein